MGAPDRVDRNHLGSTRFWSFLYPAQCTQLSCEVANMLEMMYSIMDYRKLQTNKTKILGSCPFLAIGEIQRTKWSQKEKTKGDDIHSAGQTEGMIDAKEPACVVNHQVEQVSTGPMGK